MKNREYKNVIWNTVGTVINSFSSLIYLIIVTRIGGIDISGVFSFCFSFSLTLYTFANLGNRIFEVSDKTLFPDSDYLTLKFFTCLISMAVALVFALIMGYESIKIFLIMIFMLVRSIEAMSDTFYAVFQKNDRLDLVGISYFLKNILCFIVFFIAYISTRKIILSAMALLLATLLVYLLFDRRLVNGFEKIRISFNIKSVFALFKNILNFILFNLLTMVIANVPRIIVDLYYTDSELGVFGILIMIPTIVILLGQLVIQPCLNGMSENFHGNNFKNISASVKNMLLLITAVAVPTTLAAYFIGPFALKLLYGIDLSGYKLSIALLVIAGMFNCYAAMLSTVLTIIRKTGIQLIVYTSIFIAETVIMAIILRFVSFSVVFPIYLGIMILQFAFFLVCYYSLFVRRYVHAEN